MSTPTNSWTLQKSNRSKGLYFQAVYGHGRTRVRVVTLGYLTSEQAQDALVCLRAGGARLSTSPEVIEAVTEDGTRYEDQIGLSDEQVKRFALDPTDRKFREMEDGWGKAASEALLAKGDYVNLPLKDYVHTVWMPVRRREAAPGTVKREEWYWGHILPVIGHVALGRVDGVKIEQFFAGKDTWHGPTRRLALNTIRVALTYAVETGVLPAVPKTRKIKDSTKRVGGRPMPLTPAQLGAVLKKAFTLAHRALYAYACSIGTRKTESSVLDWSDVDWQGNKVRVRGTKTVGSDRVVSLPPLARRELEALWVSEGRPLSGRAFMYKGRPIGDWKKGFKATADRAGITTRVYPGLARHTFATMAALHGVPKSSAKETMGHSSRSRMIDEAYDNPTPDMVADVMAGFDPLGVVRARSA